MNGILFKPDMIKAIVIGNKSQTRRLSGLEEVNKQPDEWESKGFVFEWGGFHFISKAEPSVSRLCKPRYRVNQVVYVKEGLRRVPRFWDERYGYHTEAVYTADNEFVLGVTWVWQKDWLSPLHLPEACARYFIRILEVRPERLQEITIEDAIAEGIKDHVAKIGANWYSDAITQYSDLWDSINPKFPWASNCWVWRYRFELCGRPE